DIFKQADAILEGHFILTSGRHSAIYMQKAQVFMHADLTEKLCRGLAAKIKKSIKEKIDYVVGPAIGGLIPSYETSRHLGVPSLWVERVNGVFELLRFKIKNGAGVIVEDIVTTGLSIRETVEALVAAGADVVASACILDRSGGKVDVGVPLIALAEYEIASYASDALPTELALLPAVKPGSRNI
uniref:orotate phosphoribosyltransferase n=1 Tax=Bartonella sp. MR168JLCBS TaxID=3243556 RepID=UPI0035CED93A